MRVLESVARRDVAKSPGRARSARDIVESIERLGYVEDLGEVIREARERLGLTQEELANLVHERVSVIKKVESGSLKPPLTLAKNLERVLKVRLVRELTDEDIHITPPPFAKRGVTLGDIVSSERKE
jgi:Predicted transcription factor, homolog of eukaryotic MBF1